MSDSRNKHWIVVLNKVPRGPLSQEQVEALLSEKMLRPNDMGYQVPEENAPQGDHSADWKLLWQFPEFARWANETPSVEGSQAPKKSSLSTPATPPAPKQDAPPPEPKEVPDIDPEELVVHGKSSSQNDLSDYSDFGEADSKGWDYRNAVYGLTAIAVMGIVAWLFFAMGSKKVDKPSRVTRLPIEMPRGDTRGMPTQIRERNPVRTRSRRRPSRVQSRETVAEQNDTTAPTPSSRAASIPKKPLRKRLVAPEEDLDEGDEGEFFPEDEFEDEYADEFGAQRPRRPARSESDGEFEEGEGLRDQGDEGNYYPEDEPPPLDDGYDY